MSFAALILYVTVLYVRPMDWPTLSHHIWQVAGFGIMDLLTAVVCLACVVKRVGEGGRVMRSATDWFVLGLFGAALMSHVAHTFLGMFKITFVDFGKIVLLYFLIVNIVDTRTKLKAFIVVIVALTAFVALHGVLQAHMGYGFGGQIPMVEHGITRVKAYGFFDDPNDLGLTLVVAMPLLLMSITAVHGVFTRVISSGLLALFGYALYLTNSRGGIMAFAVMGFVYFYKRFGKTFSIALGTLLVVGILNFGPSRVQTMGDDSSGTGRRAIWSQGLHMFKQRPQNPVFGVGWRRFGEFTEKGKTAHNSFLLAAVEMGLLGLFFYLGAFYVPLRDLHRLTIAELPEDADPDDLETLRSDRALARALIASVIGFAAAAFFLSRTYNQIPYILIGVCAAMARIVKTEPIGEEAALPDPDEDRLFYDFRASDFRWISAGTLATIPLIYVLCRVLWRL